MPQPPPTVAVSTVSTSFFKVETLQTTDAVAVSTVSTVSTKKHNVEIKNKIKVNQLLAKCYTPSGGLLLVKAKSTEHKKWMEEVNPC
jgi:hypothetical protein